MPDHPAGRCSKGDLAGLAVAARPSAAEGMVARTAARSRGPARRALSRREPGGNSRLPPLAQRQLHVSGGAGRPPSRSPRCCAISRSRPARRRSPWSALGSLVGLLHRRRVVERPAISSSNSASRSGANRAAGPTRRPVRSPSSPPSSLPGVPGSWPPTGTAGTSPRSPARPPSRSASDRTGARRTTTTGCPGSGFRRGRA